MSTKKGCSCCEHAENLHGCATKHVGEARKMLSEGKYAEVDKQLQGFEKHLKE